jgi:hypothetical protein
MALLYRRNAPRESRHFEAGFILASRRHGVTAVLPEEVASGRGIGGQPTEEGFRLHDSSPKRTAVSRSGYI